MATFLMFGKYSQESAKRITAKRTDATVKLIEKYGGKLAAACKGRDYQSYRN